MAATSALALAAWLGAAGLAGPASAQTGENADVAVRTSNYVDDDNTTISTTAVAARASALENVTFNVRALVDVTSSASVDVISAATDRWSEVRTEGLGGATYADGTNTLSATYILSDEPDWRSHNVSVGGSRDFFDHNVTLGIGASYVDNAVGRADDVNFARSMQVYGGVISAVWVGDPENIFSVNYTLGYNEGYQASPYRYAYLRDGTGLLRALPESHPAKRTRHAVTFLWNRHVWRSAALRSHLRGYLDDWGLYSVTGGSEFLLGMNAYRLGLSVRGYAQRHAAFYRDVYDQPYMYMTSDRELSTFYDIFAGASAGWHDSLWKFEPLSIEVKLVGFAFFFPEFERLPRRLGLIADVGVRALW